MTRRSTASSPSRVGNSDEVALEPGEEPGQETRPDDAVKSADEVDPDGGQ